MLTQEQDESGMTGIMSARERLKWLTERVKDEGLDMGTKLKVIELMNKMQGCTQKAEANAGREITISIALVDEE